MAPSDAQKKASNKYNKEHMMTLGCKIKKSDAAAFKAYATEKGTTPNALLRGYVYECIGKADDQGNTE